MTKSILTIVVSALFALSIISCEKECICNYSLHGVIMSTTIVETKEPCSTLKHEGNALGVVIECKKN